MLKSKGNFFCLLASMFFFQSLKATHIVGGEMNYRVVGPLLYEIRLTVYRDCFNGIPPFDDPASVGIFNASGTLVGEVLMDRLQVLEVPDIINSPCLMPPDDICYEVTTYIDTITLSPSPGGYTLAYQRCCRNNTILNIVAPEDAGATYIAQVPDPGLMENSNPVFVNLPPTFICRNYPFFFNHAAFDWDGDSLVYSLFTPLNGASPGFPMPQPPAPPPYATVVWQPPFNLSNVFGGVPLSVNPETGILTATPNTIGQFVYGVRVMEYRGGVYISETRREFQANVINCVGLVVAAIQSPIILCGSNTASFTNNSIGAAGYLWDFGVSGTDTDTSTQFEPVYTFPDTGTYNVRLIAFSSTSNECNDTSNAIVRVYPELFADIGKLYNKCVPSVFFFDSTQSFSGNITNWSWNFGDGSTSTSQSTVHGYSAPGTYVVTLSITTDAGCTDFITDTVEILPPLGGFIDSIVPATCQTICNGSVTLAPFGGTPPYSMLWSNGDTTVLADSLCPDGYTVQLLDSNNCQLNLSATIPSTFFSQFSGVVPAVCEGVCTGSATITISGGTAPINVLWSNADTTSTIDSLCPGDYSVVVTDSNNCILQDTVEIVTTFLADLIKTQNPLCFEDCNGEAEVLAAGGGEPYTYTWSHGPTGALVSQLCEGLYIVTTTDTNGCTAQDTVLMQQPPLLEGEPQKTDAICPGDCNGKGEQFITGGTPPYFYEWDEDAFKNLQAQSGLCPGWHKIETVDENGCVYLDSIEVLSQFTSPPIACYPEKDTIFNGETVQLYSDPGSGYLYSWTDPATLSDGTSPNPFASPVVTTQYSLKVTDENGCPNLDSLRVIVITDYCLESRLFIPTGFTPDGDGRNDVFRIRAEGLKEVRLAVFNRWGEKVFETEDPSSGWDGNYKGAPSPTEVYVFYLTATCFDGNANFKKGNITLIR